MKLRQLMPWVLLIGLILGACTATPAPPAVGMDDNAEVMPESVDSQAGMDDSKPDEMASDESTLEQAADEMMAVPEWFSAQLVDVNTGETFTINDLQGQVVLVETMAVWCSNCLRQQGEVQALHAALGEREDFTSIALDIDPNEDADILRSFAASRGFDWLYAVAPVDVARQFGDLYGQQFLNPPSTPILLIDRHGEVHLLPFGIKSAGELQNSVESLLNAEI
jgi:hypothetical protein